MSEKTTTRQDTRSLWLGILFSLLVTVLIITYWPWLSMALVQ